MLHAPMTVQAMVSVETPLNVNATGIGLELTVLSASALTVWHSLILQLETSTVMVCTDLPDISTLDKTTRFMVLIGFLAGPLSFMLGNMDTHVQAEQRNTTKPTFTASARTKELVTEPPDYAIASLATMARVAHAPLAHLTALGMAVAVPFMTTIGRRRTQRGILITQPNVSVIPVTKALPVRCDLALAALIL
jgi:hypothetical protein